MRRTRQYQNRVVLEPERAEFPPRTQVRFVMNGQIGVVISPKAPWMQALCASGAIIVRKRGGHRRPVAWPLIDVTHV